MYIHLYFQLLITDFGEANRSTSGLSVASFLFWIYFAKIKINVLQFVVFTAANISNTNFKRVLQVDKK